MYAVIKTGAHQLKVAEGETHTIDRIAGNVGDKVTFDQVLMVGGNNVQLGTPVVNGAKVDAVIKDQKTDDKITVFKYMRRKKYKVTRGHKQPITVVEINKIHA